MRTSTRSSALVHVVQRAPDFRAPAAAAAAAFAMVLVAGGARAGDPPITSVDTLETAPSPTARERVDSAHVAISRAVGTIARRLDSFFVDETVDEESSGNQIRLRLGTEVADREGVSFKQRVRANLDLPNTRHRIQLLIEDTSDADEGGDSRTGLTGDDDESFTAAALRFLLRENETSIVQLSGGMRFRPEPDPFVRLRGRRTFEYRKWAFRPTQFLTWEREDGFGETTRFDVDRRLFDTELVRTRLQATWSETSEGVDWRGEFSFSAGLSDRRAYRAAFGVRGETEPPGGEEGSSNIERYRSTFTYRQRVYKDWLFVELEPALELRRKHEYDVSPAITFRVEALFGDPWTVGPDGNGFGKSPIEEATDAGLESQMSSDTVSLRK